jgi:copper transport protein
VNSFEALFTTLYGNLLILKLAMFTPLLLIAAINLMLTHRNLREGKELWSGRLRGLVGVEVILTVAVLGVVGAMTSISPAKNTYEARLAMEAQQIPPNPIVLSVTTNDLLGEMTVSPGYIGNNTFSLKLTDEDGNPVEDASRIRLIFRNLDLGGGDSELRMEHQGEGVYVVEGANIAAIGEWRMRATVAIPEQFDRLYDFVSVVEAAPLPPELPEVDPTAPLPNRVPIMLAIGLLALGVGGFFLGESRLRLRRGGAFVATGLVIVGVAFLVSSLGSIPT